MQEYDNNNLYFKFQDVIDYSNFSQFNCSKMSATVRRLSSVLKVGKFFVLERDWILGSETFHVPVGSVVVVNEYSLPEINP